MPSLSWSQCIAELHSKCPTLYQVLWTIVSRSDKRNRVKRGDQHFPGMCAATAILLKVRNKHMIGMQTMLSVILYSSRVQKKVCGWVELNKQHICKGTYRSYYSFILRTTIKLVVSTKLCTNENYPLYSTHVHVYVFTCRCTHGWITSVWA